MCSYKKKVYESKPKVTMSLFLNVEFLFDI